MYIYGSGCNPPLIVWIDLTVHFKFGVALLFGFEVISKLAI